MMQKLRPALLVVICLVLAVLVWLDFTGNDPSSGDSGQTTPGVASDIKAGADENQPTEPADLSETQPMEAAGYQTESAQDASQDAETGAEPKDEDSVSNPLSSLGMEQLSETVERPLFAPTRKRPPPQEAGAPAVQQKETTYELLGVALGGTRPVAVMRKKGDGKSFRVEVGDTLSGWHVTKVDAREVRLERDGADAEVVRLFRK
jgi:hypothetical protein